MARSSLAADLPGAGDSSRLSVPSPDYIELALRAKLPHENRAVIVAEEITNRFFNVISLLDRAVPVIAIQMNALQVKAGSSCSVSRRFSMLQTSWVKSLGRSRGR